MQDSDFLVFEESYFVDPKNIKLFAEVAGDPNPIHQDENVAREMGLTAPIAHGMFIYSYLLRRLDEYLEVLSSKNSKKYKLQEARCRFNNPVAVKNTYKSRLEVTSHTEQELKVTALFLDNQSGEKLTQVVARVSIIN